MVCRLYSTCFKGIEVIEVAVEIGVSSGLPSFQIVGLPNKAIDESKERVRAALSAVGISFPAKKITVNLAPADLLKEGSHFDLGIACAILSEIDILPKTKLEKYVIMGELGLDGRIAGVSGVLPTSIMANQKGKGIICPYSQGSEAAWAGNEDIVAVPDLLTLIGYFKGTHKLSQPETKLIEDNRYFGDISEIKGQETAKRALEIAAAGGHNMLMVGPPGAGKSMLSSRILTILPKMDTQEILDVSMIYSIAGMLDNGGLMSNRPFRTPHHTASAPAMIGGGKKARPGEISLAHNGVMFLDELPEFQRSVLETLRHPMDTGKISIARAENHITYPANFQLIAAMNPCKCGYLGTKDRECSKAPRCAEDYQSKISGPLLDRIDIHIKVGEVSPWDLSSRSGGESSEIIALRVKKAIDIQKDRFKKYNLSINRNARVDGKDLEELANIDEAAKQLLIISAEKMQLSARGYFRTLRLARTIADLEASEVINSNHIAESLSFRRNFIKKR